MSRNIIAILTVGIMLILLGGLYYALSQVRRTNVTQTNPTTKPTPVMTPLPSIQNFSEGVIATTSANPVYTVSVKYPQFTDQSPITNAIAGAMQQKVSQFRQAALKATQNPNLPAAMKQSGSTLDVTYKVFQSGPKIYSVQFMISENFPGLAQPDNTNQTFTFDATGKPIQLATLFKPNSNYLQTLSNVSQQQIATQLSTVPNIQDFLATGASPRETNFKLFTLSQDGLQLIFNPAQVGPDYAGTQIVTIPYAQLADILNPQYLTP